MSLQHLHLCILYLNVILVCDENTTLTLNGSCYLVVTDQSVDMATAISSCESMGAHLVFIETSEEQEFLQTTLETLDPGGHYWIGVEQDQDGTLVWMDGTNITYSNFGPIDEGGMCFRITSKRNYEWGGQTVLI